MKIEGLFELRKDNKAVSPVIGVILMVAITVILAAVIGTFVLGLGQEMNKNAPTAQISFSQSSGNVGIAHDGGDDLAVSEISIQVNDPDGDTNALGASDKDATNWDTASPSGKITAGESFTLGTALDSDDTVKVIWTSEDGGTSQVIAEYDVN